MDFSNLFPTNIAFGRIDDADQCGAQYLAAAERVRATTANGKPASWACNVYTTLRTCRDLHRQPGFEGLEGKLLKAATDFAIYLEIDLTVVEPHLIECWLNVYRRGDAQEVHNHSGHDVSGIYYLQCPPKCGQTNFYTPLYEEDFSPIPGQRQSWKSQGQARFEPTAGDIVLFRSWLRHSVSASESDSERVSIAFNLIFRAKGHAPGIVKRDVGDATQGEVSA
ncbi:MAG: hypothetical protein K0U93_28455 [Gammaproteobacteria bacterium]|nr:hypothetical protein [Gammaproteobacteria bacterium]